MVGLCQSDLPTTTYAAVRINRQVLPGEDSLRYMETLEVRPGHGTGVCILDYCGPW